MRQHPTAGAPQSSLARSSSGIVQTPIEIKRWLSELPSVEAVRPARCTGCGAASRCPGRGLGLHGHGVVRRDFWGPIEAGDTPEFHDLLIRRFRCVHCHVVLRVGPSGILPRRRYWGGAILGALALWALFGEVPEAVREAMSPWRHVSPEAERRWPSLLRWAAGADELWPLRRPLPEELLLRERASTVVRSLVARLPTLTWGPIGLEQVFAAAHGAGGRV